MSKLLKHWNPVQEVNNFEHQIVRALGLTPFFSFGNGEGMKSIAQWSPSVDVIEDDKEWLVKADLPEVKKEDVKVSVDRGVLTITGERKTEKEEKNKRHHWAERAYGQFVRSFTLPDDANAEAVTAEFKDGVLTLHMPKMESAKSKPMEIKIS